MWQIFLKSRLFAWLSAIGSALLMVYMLWTSSRKVQSAETRSSDAIALEKDKTRWTDEKAATQIVEQTLAHDAERAAVIEVMNTQAQVAAKDDAQVRTQLSDKWTRKDM